MDNARTPKVLAPKASISAAQWFEENAFVGCRDMEPANVGRRFRHDGAPAGEAGTSAGQDEARPVDRANCQLPRMADLYAGPNTPLSKAFIFCGLGDHISGLDAR